MILISKILLDVLLYFFRYCLFGLNVALTEKFESNSMPMKIHISEPCKNLLTPQYKTEERTDNPDLSAKVMTTELGLTKS